MRFLLTPQFLRELWRHCLPLAPAVAKREGSRLLLPYPSRTLIRPMFTDGSLKKDVTQPKQTEQTEEKLDVDIWKSVMRSQVPLEEKQEGDEEGVPPPGVPRGAAEEHTPLEATREMVEMWRQAGKLVPENMTDAEVQIVTDLTTKSSMKKFLKYLAIKEGHKKAHKEKRERKKAEWASLKEERMKDREGDEDEGELKNTFLVKFWQRSLDRLLGWRSSQAMVFGQPLVFDMSYEQNMGRREMENAVSQLMEVEGWNRRAADPFHLHFCNLQPDSGYQRQLHKRYGAEAWERLLITATDQRHVDVFPSERLVYLTADSPNVLRAFDHSKVYVVGSLVDRSIQSGVSLANAKRLKLATARLPLDEFLHWEKGAKNLTLDQMVRILLTMKEKGSWKEALDFVPKRKHDGFHPQQQQPAQRKIWEREGPAARAYSRMGTSEGTDNRTRDKWFKGGDGDGERMFRARDGDRGRTFRAGDGRPSNSHKDMEFAGGLSDREVDPPRWTGDETKLPTRLRTSLKSKMEEGRYSSGRKRNDWWKED